MRDYDRALADFIRAAELNPQQAVLSSEDLPLRKGDYDHAVIYNHALELNPQDTLTYRYRGDAYAEMDNYELAIAD